jgi:hypothetical protein
MKLSRPEFIEQIGGISIASLARWEGGKIVPPKLKLKQMVHFFNQNHINVTEDWLTDGIGLIPTSTHPTENKPTFDEYSARIFDSISTHIPNLTVLMCNTNNAQPYASHGDYIAGKLINDAKTLDNKLAFHIKDKQINLGVYVSHVKAVVDIHSNAHYIEDAQFGEVLWIAKRT